MENKSIHYTEREKLLLAQLVSEEKAIENKKTGATDLRQKADAWERITLKYISEGCTPRSSKQLKKCWDNLKQRKRKLTTVQKHKRLMTGGGPALVQQQDPVMDFIDATSANVDIEIDCPFDSTAAFERQYDIEPSCSSFKRKIIETEEDTNYNEEDAMQDLVKSSLPQHLSTKKKRTSSSNDNIEDIRDEKELRLIKIREAIKQQRELHKIKMDIAKAEEKIVILNLLKKEEAVRLM